MKKVLLICCFLIGITATTHAQDSSNKTPEEKAKELQTKLHLSDDQTTKVTNIYKEQAPKTDSAETPLKQSTDTKIKAVLTPEQMVSYDKVMKDNVSPVIKNNTSPIKDKIHKKISISSFNH